MRMLYHADEHAPLYWLTNAFSKKIDNLAAAVALHFMRNNVCRADETLRVTPAMEAGMFNHVW